MKTIVIEKTVDKEQEVKALPHISGVQWLNKLKLGEYFWTSLIPDENNKPITPRLCRKVLRKNEWGTSVYVIETRVETQRKPVYFYRSIEEHASILDEDHVKYYFEKL